jgi:UDP-N-acetylmuramate dehydrogenase
MSELIKENISLKSHTVFKRGGAARFFAEVKSAEELKAALSFAKEKGLPFFIAGAGSNILVADKGFDGLYVKNAANKIVVDGRKIVCESGVMMPNAAAEAARAGLSGLEWGIGIPGTVGGSVRGNAGCFGGEIKDVVESVEVFDAHDGVVKKFFNGDCKFGYRDSIFKKYPQLVILSAAFALYKDKADEVRRRMRNFVEKRAETQDIGAKCAGCVFKNVPWTRRDIDKAKLLARFPVLSRFASEPAISAGFLIDEVGLKGKKIGGAMISRKHANFFLNTGEATAEDIVMLMALAKERIHSKFGILLEEEIQYVGFE